MERLTALAVLIAGCGFHSPSGPDETPGGDASAGACVPGFLDLCEQAEPSTMFEVAGALMINTDSDPRCQTLAQTGGGDVCLIYATAVVIDKTTMLTVTGKRPLAIASISTLKLEGTVDVSSHGEQRGPGADAAACNFAGAPANDDGGAGGGAGGSFPLAGGDGGSGDKNHSSGGPTGVATPGKHGATTTISVLRGGCPGQAGGDEGGGSGTGVGGTGGRSGGALYLFARQGVALSGIVRATGNGGEGGGGMAGGGGGGTGGLVVIESPSIMSSGRISANGGGGGQGGGIITTGGILKNTTRIPGNPGHDGDMTAVAAAGGSGAASNDPGFGRGGAGGAGPPAASGATADFGGGGGGGAAGLVIIRSKQPQLAGVISPAPAIQ